MTDPLRLRVLKGLTGTLRTITPANGYTYDLSVSPDAPKGRVFRGRTLFGAETPVPFASILEVPIPTDQITSRGDNPYLAGAWDLIIQGWTDDDEENPTDPAHIFLADVKRALVLAKQEQVRSETIFGEKAVYDLTIGPGTVRPPDEVSAWAFFWLGLTVHMAEDLKDPYA